MLGLIRQIAIDDAADFVNGVTELQAAIFNVDVCFAVTNEQAVNIGKPASGPTESALCSNSWRRSSVPRANFWVVLQALYASRPFPAGPTPSDFSFRCSADLS